MSGMAGQPSADTSGHRRPLASPVASRSRRWARWNVSGSYRGHPGDAAVAEERVRVKGAWAGPLLRESTIQLASSDTQNTASPSP